MKYILPENLKTYPFPCDDCKDCVTYTRCKKHCPEAYRSCWENNLRKDLQLDCDVENEQHFGKYVVCASAARAMLSVAVSTDLCAPIAEQ